MSDVTGGAGWWLASDGRWYPPELHPAVQAPPATPDPEPLPTFGFDWPPARPGPAGTPPGGTRTLARTGPPPAAVVTPVTVEGTRAPRRRRWLVAVALVVAVVAAGVGVVITDGSGGWVDGSLHVVGGPVAADGVAVVFDVDAGHQLRLSGIQPSDGRVLWSRPYSTSDVTPGEQYAPVAVGATVLDVVPAGGAGSPVVTLEGLDARTGARRWALPGRLVVTDAPVTCGSDRLFCVATSLTQTTTGLVALDPGNGRPTGVVPGPDRNMGVSPAGVANDATLWETGDPTPTFLQISPSGQQAWVKPVAGLFGGPQYDPDYGWDFVVQGSLDVGSVGTAPTGTTYSPGADRTLGISTADGSVVWNSPGDFMCGGSLQFLSPDLACRYTGTVRRTGTSVSTAGLSLSLAGFDGATGATTWTRTVEGAKALSLGSNVAFSDSDHLVVVLPGGRRVLLDVRTGTIRPVPTAGVYWCEELPMYKVATSTGASADGTRVSAPVFRGCTAAGAPVSSVPATRPTAVGTTVGGAFVWASPSGLRAVPASA